jgi:hypothetical protein
MRVILLFLGLISVNANNLRNLVFPNGTKLMEFIDCYAWWQPDAAHRPDNSQTAGCNQESILYCKTDSGNNDHLCKFDGTNVLTDSWDTTSCYFNCQMETCNAWTSPSTDLQKQCVKNLLQS